MGFFAHLMSLITLIKLFCIFYIRLSYIKRLCKSANSRYEASRISSLLNTFLLVSFIFSLTPMAYIIGSMQPSNACGPFRSSNDVHYYTGVVWTLINDWESGAGRSIFLTISKPSVLMSTSAAILMVNYFTYLNYSSMKEYNSRIEKQLRDINQEIRTQTNLLNLDRKSIILQ